MDYVFKFEGRLRRTRYFTGSLFVLVATFASTFLFGFENEKLLPLTILISICATILQLNLAARRCNDLGWSGWFVLLFLVPIANVLFLLILLFMKGSIGPNVYGEDPTVRPMIDDLTDHKSPQFESRVDHAFSARGNLGSQIRPTQEERQINRVYQSTAKEKPKEANPSNSTEEGNLVTVFGYVILGCILLLVGISVFSSSVGAEDDKIAKMQEGIQLFNDEKYSESFQVLSEYYGENFFSDEANYSIAYMYGEGLGTDENDDAANNIMNYLSGLPNSEYSKWADNYLGFQYLNGEGVQKSSNEAYNKFLAAARKDVPFAMLQVAQLYHIGEGTRKDLRKAKYWYEKAAENNIQEAIDALNGNDFIQRSQAVNVNKNISDTYYESEDEYVSTEENEYEYLNGLEIMTSSGGNLWASEDSDNSIIVGYVPKGAVVNVINTDTRNSSYFFVDYDGQKGYLSTANLLK